jgi:UDPglucose 6-dehydrogenase
VRVVIIGTGYVGLTTGISLSYLGHEVVGVDKDEAKLRLLREGRSPIHEPGLDELFADVRERIEFTSRTEQVVGNADLIMIAVGTPPKENGEADVRYVESAALEVARGLKSGRTYTLVVKSTVPIGSNRRVAHVVNRVLSESSVDASVYFASNPEFLREGFALQDTFYPDRIVVGAEHTVATDSLRRLYRPILEQTFAAPRLLPRPQGYALPPLITTDPTSSEMIKYSSNAFLALKISFTNEIAGLCERVGADVTEVARGMGLDSRIGPRFLGAGLGWGGSCFPKDTAALIAVGAEYGYPMPIVEASREVNARQRHAIIEKLQSALKVVRGRTIGVLGLAFKPNTDDVREAPALEIIRTLVERGAHVRAHDPIATANAKRDLEGVEVDYCDSPYQVVEGADAVVLATEWDMYRQLNLEEIRRTMRHPVLIDGRNLIDPGIARKVGLTYVGVGR